jgi:retron-type reverse transcriptase
LWSNLLLACRRAQCGKRFKDNVAAFNFGRERELLGLQQELREQTYQPGPYFEFYIREPKKRLISAAPYRDRVVHHALCNVIEPIFDATFIHNSFACRVGKGQHQAADRFTYFARRYPWVLKCDIQKYFPSMDHDILFEWISRKIGDGKTLWLIRRILDASNPQEPFHPYFPGDDLFTPFERRRGLPIGNLTSQMFANVYLNGFDHFVTQELGLTAYLRYCDDFAAFAKEKAALHEAKVAMQGYLNGLRLKLHRDKCHVSPVEKGVDFVGYRIFPSHRLLRPQSARRGRRRLRWRARQYRDGEISLAQVKQCVMSWLGHASHADTWGWRRLVLKEIRL